MLVQCGVGVIPACRVSNWAGLANPFTSLPHCCLARCYSIHNQVRGRNGARDNRKLIWTFITKYQAELSIFAILDRLLHRTKSLAEMKHEQNKYNIIM